MARARRRARPLGPGASRSSARRRSTCTPTEGSGPCTGCRRPQRAVRWASLFSSPFFHPTVIVDRAVLDRHGLRYDTSFPESEDYDLWSRLLEVAEGDNVSEPLVLYRRHDAQASARRRELQLECRRRVALRQIAKLVPRLGPRARGARLVRRQRPRASERGRGRGRRRAERARRRPSRRGTVAPRRAAPRPGRSPGGRTSRQTAERSCVLRWRSTPCCRSRG